VRCEHHRLAPRHRFTESDLKARLRCCRTTTPGGRPDTARRRRLRDAEAAPPKDVHHAHRGCR
jgi:hypothetical protein